jgi:Tol biopolymer transport system component
MPREYAISEPTFQEESSAVSSSSQATLEQGPKNCERLSAKDHSSSALENLPEYYRRVLNSAELVRSERLRVLLLHMLRAVDHGAAETLTERSIGIEVFGKARDWDPTIDPCVRVAIGRLRAKLAEYYENSGHNDASKILLAKGSYVPQIVHSKPAGAGANTIAPDSVPLFRDGRGTNEPAPRKRRISLSFVAILLLLFALLLTIRWKVRNAANHTADQFVITPFSTEAGTQFSPAISPDGNKIAYVWDGNRADFHIYIRPIDGGPTVEVPGGSGGDFYPSWSPDGSHLAFVRTDTWEGKLMVVPAAGGNQQVIGSVGIAHGRWAEDSGPLLGDPGPVWSPDGRELIAFDQGHFGIYAISLATEQRRQLTFDTETTRDFYPCVSPDGRWLAFIRYISHGVGDLYVLSLQAGGELRQLTHDQRTIRGIAWSPDSRTLTIASNRGGPFELWTVNVQKSTIEPLPSDTASAADPSLANNENWLAFDNLREVVSVDQVILPNASRSIPMRPLISSLGRDRWAARSPDGMKIAFTSDRSGTWQIWLTGQDGSAPKQVTHLGGSLLGGASWAPDSRHLVFDGRPSGHSAIYLLDTATGVSTRLLPDSSAEDRLPIWSPDGRQIYFSSDKDGSVGLYRMAMDSRQITLVAHDGYRAQPTQDGRWIYYATMFDVLWRVPADGGVPTQLPSNLQTYSSSSWAVVGNNLVVLKKGRDPNMLELLEANPALHVHLVGTIALAPQTAVLSVQSSETGRELFLDVRTQLTSEIVLRKRLASK